jgi:hypothetical protein
MSMSKQPAPHVTFHPLRLAFWLHPGSLWVRWWGREALAAANALDRQEIPERTLVPIPIGAARPAARARARGPRAR